MKLQLEKNNKIENQRGKINDEENLAF